MNKQVEESLIRMTHARPSSEYPWYSPARDISTLVPALIAEALGDLEDTGSDHRRLMERLGRNEKELTRVAESLALFVSKECIVDVGSFKEAMLKSKLGDIPPEVRLPLMSALGEELLCAFWYAARSATTQKDDEGNFTITQYEPALVAVQAKKFTHILRLPRWKRRITLWWWKFRADLSKMFQEKKD